MPEDVIFMTVIGAIVFILILWRFHRSLQNERKKNLRYPRGSRRRPPTPRNH